MQSGFQLPEGITRKKKKQKKPLEDGKKKKKILDSEPITFFFFFRFLHVITMVIITVNCQMKKMQTFKLKYDHH